MLFPKKGILSGLREVTMISIAIVATYIVSTHLAPWYIGSSLSSGVGQTGWPMAYWMKTWVGQYPSGTEMSSFNFLFLAIDVSLFYFLVNCMGLLVGYLRRRSRRENNPLRLSEWAQRIVKHMIVMLVLIFIVYGVLSVLVAILFGSGPAQAVTPK